MTGLSENGFLPTLQHLAANYWVIARKDGTNLMPNLNLTD
jgi:hypothetical protein